MRFPFFLPQPPHVLVLVAVVLLLLPPGSALAESRVAQLVEIIKAPANEEADFEKRMAAIKELESIVDPSEAEELIKAVSTETDTGILTPASRALAGMGKKEAVKPLIRALQNLPAQDFFGAESLYCLDPVQYETEGPEGRRVSDFLS
jgi:HEAT repeat protein